MCEEDSCLLNSSYFLKLLFWFRNGINFTVVLLILLTDMSVVDLQHRFFGLSQRVSLQEGTCELTLMDITKCQQDIGNVLSKNF